MDRDEVRAIRIAAEAAARAHRDQVRKDGSTPYLVHPASVSLLVARYGGSTPAIIAAWMHDIIEDCRDDAAIVARALSAMPLREGEKGTILAMVRSLTKDRYIADEEERLRDSLIRICEAPPEATLVKLCDRIDNLIDAQQRDPSFTLRYLKGTHETIGILGERAREHGYVEPLALLITIRDQVNGREGR